MTSINTYPYSVQIEKAQRHLRTGDESEIDTLIGLLGRDLDELRQEWADEERALTPEDALRCIVTGVNQHGRDILYDATDWNDGSYIRVFELLVQHYGEALDGWEQTRRSWFGTVDKALAAHGSLFSVESLMCEGVEELPVGVSGASVGYILLEDIPEALTDLADAIRRGLPSEVESNIADVQGWLQHCVDHGTDLACFAG
ncbi:hypothetical protein [Nocardia sp. NBC_00511]|uniref:DUF7691 family protein n=1 Tax=Nocardia sp. NBC_00511 TaxID=2903591 RepID=UPI0030DF8A36